MQRNSAVPELAVKCVVWQICKGLKKLHGENITVRDIAADTVFIKESGEVKFGDFGVSELL